VKRLVVGLLLVVALLLGFTGYIVATESGLGFVVGRLQQWAPDKLKIESASGKLTGPLQVRGFGWQSETFALSVGRVDLEWSPALLFSGNLKVGKLHVEDVNFQSLAPAPNDPEAKDQQPFTLPQRLPIPISIELADIKIRDISLTPAPGQEPVEIELISLVADYSKPEDQLKQSTLAIASELLDAKLELTTTTAEQYNFNGNLSWQLRLPEQETMAGKATFSGNTETAGIETELQDPYSINASVSISEPVTNPAFTGTINLAIEDASEIKTDIPALGIAGQINTEGSPNNLTIVSNISLQGLIPQTIFTQINARLQNQILALDNAQFTVENHPLKVRAQGSVDTSKATPLLDLALGWTQLSWPLDAEPVIKSPEGNISIKGTSEDLALQLESLVANGEVTATGQLQGESLHADVSWHHLQWPANGSQASDINGHLNLKGNLSDYFFEVTSNADTTAVTNVQLAASGKGSQQALQVQQLSLAALDGKLRGKGEVTWSPDLSFEVSLEGQQFNPVTLIEELPGAIDLRISASGQQNNNIFSAALDELSIEGRLRDLPVAINVKGDGQMSGADDFTVNLDNLQLASGPTQLEAKGKISNTLNVAWSLNSPDLSTLWPTTAGKISGEGVLLGSKQSPELEMTLDANALQIENFSLASLALQANVAAGPQGNMEVNLDLNGANISNAAISEFSLVSNGQIDDHRITLRGRSNQGDIDADLLGSFGDQQWSWNLLASKLAYPQLAPWTLREATKGRVSTDSFTMENTCFVSGTASLCAQANQSSEQLQASYQLNSLPLGYFRPLLPENIDLSGLLESSGSAQQETGDDLSGNISLRLDQGGLDVTGPEQNKVRVVNIDPAIVDSKLGPDGLRVRATLDFANQGKLDSGLVITGSPDNLAEGDLSGQLSGFLTDISFLQELVPELSKLGGRMASDIDFSGKLSQPVINGSLSLREGKAELGTPGLFLNNISATLSGTGDGTLTINSEADSGVGSARIDGIINFATNPVSLSAQLTGKEFAVINTSELKAAISPDLDINLRANTLQLEGDITIPSLRITTRELPAGTAQVSDDQVFANPEDEEVDDALPLDVRANLRVIMGEDILIDAFGLRTGLSGELTVNETPDQQTTASGQLETIDGTFKAYGQNLQIRTGRIIYVGGPISKPGFDIDAIREINTNLLVGVRARGALSEPEFSLFSEPSLPESEQMSYLVFGRPLENNSPGEQSAVRQAAMALGVAGGTFLTEKFGDRLGLDEVKIDSELRESGEQAALVVGKYLSPKLYVSYGLGLFEPVTALRLRYSISENIKLVTETTESEEGGDLIFTFQSDE